MPQWIGTSAIPCEPQGLFHAADAAVFLRELSRLQFRLECAGTGRLARVCGRPMDRRCPKYWHASRVDRSPFDAGHPATKNPDARRAKA